jgi:hypothetical protein
MAIDDEEVRGRRAVTVTWGTGGLASTRVLVGLGGVDDLLNQDRDIGEPSLEAGCHCGRELVQHLVPIGT